MKNKILEVKNLRKTYHDSNGEIEAIKNINFDIYEKEMYSRFNIRIDSCMHCICIFAFLL